MFHLKVRPGYDCDIIVVGAGPAGASAAAHATRAGLKVVLIDQHKFPRDKVCGDFVSPLALVELRRLGVTANPEYRKSNIIHSAAVHVDGKTLITSLIPDVPGLPSHGVVAPRMALDAWILQAAVSAGTQLYEGYRVKDYHVDEDAVVVHAEQSGAARGAQRQWRARLLIGADGSSSIIARVMHGRGPLKKDRILAVRAYFEGIQGPADQADLFFSSDSFPGYYWLFPTGENTANVGVGMLLEVLPAPTEHLPVLLKRLIEQDLALANRLGSGHQVGKTVGWPLTTYNPDNPVVADRVMLVGDAAGLINPLNGEGIQYALLSGRWAIETALKTNGSDGFSMTALSSYALRLHQELRYDMALAALIVQLIRNRTLNPLWMQSLRVIINRARVDSNYATVTGGVLSGILPANSVMSLPVIGGTVQQAMFSFGLGVVKHSLRGPNHLIEIGLDKARSGIEIAAATAQRPVEAISWGGDVTTSTLELATQVIKHLPGIKTPAEYVPPTAVLRLKVG